MELSHWDLVDQFTLFEAACLATGIDPNCARLLEIGQREKVKFVEKAMSEGYKLAQACAAEKLANLGAAADSLLMPETLPSIQLAQELSATNKSANEFASPQAFIDKSLPAHFSRKAISDWFDAKGHKTVYDFSEKLRRQSASRLRDSVPIPTVEKPLSTTERTTLLVIIAALCEHGTIKPKERGAAMQIAKLTEEIGAPVSDDRVREWLKKIPDALESRMR